MNRDRAEQKLSELSAIRERMFADYNQLLGMIAAYEEVIADGDEETVEEVALED